MLNTLPLLLLPLLWGISLAFYSPRLVAIHSRSGYTRLSRHHCPLRVSVKDHTKERTSEEARDLSPEQTSSSGVSKEALILGAGLAIAAIVAGTGQVDFNALSQELVEKIDGLGPYGYLYFALFYVIAEVLAIPAAPLTASSGYLFGLVPGFLTVLTSATIAATISFYIGRTFLRDWALRMAAKWPQWMAVDKAVNKEGFKVVLLLRLSPLLPFALSNYLYGLTSVDFWSYVSATFLGFSPGTLAIVYAGSAGKVFNSDDLHHSLKVFQDLFDNDGVGLPWYVYAGGFALIVFIAQTVGKIATTAIQEMESGSNDSDS